MEARKHRLFFFFSLRFYTHTHTKRTSLHLKPDLFPYLVQNIIPQTVLSVQLRGQEGVGEKKEKKRIRNILGCRRQKILVVMSLYKYNIFLRRTTKNPTPKEVEDSTLVACPSEMTLPPQVTGSFFPGFALRCHVPHPSRAQQCRGRAERWQMNHKQRAPAQQSHPQTPHCISVFFWEEIVNFFKDWAVLWHLLHAEI